MKVTVKRFISSCVEFSSRYVITDSCAMLFTWLLQSRAGRLHVILLWRQGRSAAEREEEASESCTSSSSMLSPLSSELPTAPLYGPVSPTGQT